MFRFSLKHAIAVCFLLPAAIPAFAQPSPAPAAPSATSSGAPVAEIDAIAYDNLRHNAKQILDAVGSLGDSFVIYQPQLFSRLPLYYPALREVEGLRQVLCEANQAKPPLQTESLAPTLDIGSSLSGIAAILALFKPGLTISGLELPAGDQVLIADFASAAVAANKKVYVPGAMAPNLEPTNPLADKPCQSLNLLDPDPEFKNPSISQEWQAADTAATQLAQKFAGWTTAQQGSAAGKQIKDALDTYAAIAKKQTTTDASGNSPLAMYITAGRLNLLLEKNKPLVLVLGVDDLGGAGWIKSKAFTIPVTYSGGASSHYYVFNSATLDSSALAAGSVTSLDTALDSKAIQPASLQPSLDKNRIVLPK